MAGRYESDGIGRRHGRWREVIDGPGSRARRCDTRIRAGLADLTNASVAVRHAVDGPGYACVGRVRDRGRERCALAQRERGCGRRYADADVARDGNRCERSGRVAAGRCARRGMNRDRIAGGKVRGSRVERGVWSRCNDGAERCVASRDPVDVPRDARAGGEAERSRECLRLTEVDGCRRRRNRVCRGR